jgi:hypothetical protein
VDKAQALRRFVRENIIKLTSTECSKNVEKKLRKEFSERNNLKPGARFTATEVAEEVVRYILRTRMLERNEFFSEVSNTEFLNSLIPENKLEVLYNAYKRSSSKLILNVEDLRNLDKKNYLEKIEKEFQDRANERSKEDIEEQQKEINSLKNELEEREKRLDKFESELNNAPFDAKIEDLEEEIESSNKHLEITVTPVWWKVLGLNRNPFETNQGLYWLSKEKYEDVVVQTPLIRKYVDDINQTPDSFSNKTIILTGEFGSGKTTVFQYLTSPAINSGLLPMMIIMNPQPSVSNLINEFLGQLLDNLSEAYFQINKSDLRAKRPSGNLYNDCLELFRLISNDAPKGFLIFVDGLHNSRIYFEHVLEFLKQLQNVQEYFANKSVNIGVIVAGSLAWENELQRSPSLSGSFYRIDTIPPLTEEFALEAVRKRIASFSSVNGDTMKIEESGLRQAFRVLNERLRKGVTFRDFLDHIRERLDLNQFAEVGLSVKVHVETVDVVKASLKRSSIGNKFQDLLRDIENSSLLRKAIQNVVILIYKNGISEQETAFKSYLPAFILLKKYDLIVQKKSINGPTFKWYLSDDFTRTIIKICEGLRLKPTRVLYAAFEQETLAQTSEAETIYGAILKSLNDLEITWSDSFPDIANLLNRSAKAIEVINQKISKSETIEATNFGHPLIWLAEGINRIVYASIPESAEQWDLFSNSWVVPENVDEMTKFVYGDFRISGNKSQLLGTLHNHAKAISQLIGLLSDQVRGEGIARLSGRTLTMKQLQKLHTFRMSFLSQMYEDVIDGVCGMLEESIREVLYPCLRAIWGSDSADELPDDIRARISRLPDRGHPRTKRESDSNYFYDMSRGEYSNVIFSKKISKAIFADLLSPQEVSDFKESIELSFSLDNRVHHRDRKKYFSSRSTEIGDILKQLPRNLEFFNRISVNFLSGCEVKLSGKEHSLIARFKPSADTTPLSKEFKISKENVDYVSQSILESLLYTRLVPNNISETFSYSEQEPEILLSIFRGLLQQGYLSIHKDVFFPIIISITHAGKILQEKYGKQQNFVPD